MSRILVVEHDQDLRTLVCNVLSDEGIETGVARDAAEAVATIKAQRPDLVLLDPRLPGVDGWGLLEHLRGTANPPPVVLLADTSDPRTLARGTRAGAAGFVPKPIELRSLVSTCRRLLGEAPTEAAAPTNPADRRVERRRALLIGARVSRHEEGPTALGELVNLSRGGAQVITVVGFELGTRLLVSLEPTLSGPPIEFEGEVRWCVRVPTGHAHGLSFVSVPPPLEIRIRELLEN